MEYIRAKKEDAQQIYLLVQNTIKTVYPKYYPNEVVDFFCALHSRENILKDIEGGCVGILWNENQIVGTGSCKGNHITRVYVAPKFQNRGCGSYIMACLEKEISASHNTAVLDASLPACHLYEKLGYRTVSHQKHPVENGVILVYEIMEKQL